MGSTFFKPGSGGNVFGKVGSFLQPAAKYMQYVSPGAHDALKTANQYQARNIVGSTPTPFAGVTPTLRDANAGYLPRTPMPAVPSATLPYQPNPQPKVGVQPVGANPWGRY